MATTTRMPIDHKQLNEQIGIMGYAEMGAHKFTRYTDALDFQARILLPGTQRTRIVKVRITLAPSDTYNIEIGYLDKKTFDWVRVLDYTDIYADQLREILTPAYIQKNGNKNK